jgi:hypothetical protein
MWKVKSNTGATEGRACIIFCIKKQSPAYNLVARPEEVQTDFFKL